MAGKGWMILPPPNLHVTYICYTNVYQCNFCDTSLTEEDIDMFFTARVLLLMPGTLSIAGLVVCIVHCKYLYALRLILRYCTVCIWHHCVCIEYYQRLRCRPAWPRRGPSGWCGCPQPSPAVHRYWIYGTNCQHDIISTYRYWICHKPSPTVHGYAANHYNDYTATPLLGVILWTQANPRQGKGSPESSETAQDVTHQWFYEIH